MFGRIAPWLPVIAATIVLVGLSAGIAGVGALWWTTHSQTVAVPGVTGMDLDEAHRIAGDAGMDITERERRADRFQPENTILFQEPPAGEIVKIGRPILVTVSDGPRKNTVPMIDGMSREDAESVLAQNSIRAGPVREARSREPKGNVLASSPPAGERIEENSEVALLVSAGPEREFAMPDLAGQRFSETVFGLTGRGLRLAEFQHAERPDLPANTVVAQSPPPGSRAGPGETVTLTLSTLQRSSPATSDLYHVVRYIVPDGLTDVRVEVAITGPFGDRSILSATYQGGAELTVPVLARDGDVVTVRLNQQQVVWKETIREP